MDSQELIEKDNYIKIMLVGESKVGKTSIINTYTGKIFQNEYNPTTTIVYNDKYFDYENNHILLNIWDGIGDEKFRSLHKIFMRDVKGFILVFDITNKKSFDELEYWAEQSHDISRDAKIIIFGNKSDLNLDQKVSEEEVKKFADKIGANFCLVSAKENNNIKEGFKNLIDQIIQSGYFEKEKYFYKLQKSEKNTEKRNYVGICGKSSKRRKLSNRERCLSCLGYYACKDCLKTGRSNCVNCCCGEEKCTKETCKGCFEYILCGLCYCCCCFNLINTHDERICCCCCPKEGSVRVYGP